MTETGKYFQFQLPPISDIEPTLENCARWVDTVLAGIVGGDDLWVFAYGSLIWHPDIPVIAQRVATAYGYHRDFCIYSYHYRGTHAAPGLVLGLDRGGSCRGVVLQVPHAEAEQVANYLWRREMVAHAYRPVVLKLRLDGQPIGAVSFVADHHHPQYAGALSFRQRVDIIGSAAGYRGSNQDYLTATLKQLRSIGIEDRRLTAYTSAMPG